MGKLKIRILAFFVSALMLSFTTACGEDEPDNPWYHEEEEENPTIPDDTDGEDRAEIQKLIKQHVSIRASYKEYAWYFHIESTLHKNLPDRKIQFGIGHGEIGYEESVSIENQAYEYSWTMNGNTKVMDFVNPFWFYFMWGLPETDDRWSSADWYYKSYMALKGKTDMFDDEKELFREIVEDLDEWEKEANRYYRPSIYVLIDEKYFYKVATYQRK